MCFAIRMNLAHDYAGRNYEIEIREPNIPLQDCEDWLANNINSLSFHKVEPECSLDIDIIGTLM